MSKVHILKVRAAYLKQNFDKNFGIFVFENNTFPGKKSLKITIVWLSEFQLLKLNQCQTSVNPKNDMLLSGS